ncbi:N-acetyl-gamma-glutamyl-phosphate reductase [Vulgatibacter incomptus]|uniref:N-acetyl-gamma-glutamyl-phosphate reductase n=1 Tax=Vulgatibacter incomptus TaxID=1391653 RepID=A0A0K1PGR8_9BACT|nr:N-acetyl-gamma-glutamyl-phosphate reductase [Vulgatibacter incomptus]AKU92314.1 N-acetyl-gamma-glutamyl-phosphate reductase [Vulgatibacter incomptus]
MASRVKAALIGGTGYGGAEILRRLLFHPRVEVVRVTAADNIGKRVGEVHFNLAGLTDLRFEELPPKEAAAGVDVVFLAMPHKVTAKVAMELFDLPVRIVDLSGDFRLRSAAEYREFYGVDHPAPERLGTFAYGLPELNREAIRTARYIASPGCFATTIALGLAPLAKTGLLKGPIRTVAATGSSGSGANPQITTHHPLRAVNLRTYKPLSHQHQPEILQTLHDAGGGEVALEFVPVSAPLPRGIFASSFVDVPESVTEERLAKAWRDAYANEPFIRVVEGRFPEVVAVAGGNYVEVAYKLSEAFDGRRSVVCFSALDNLVKGGAGQAIQAFNVMMGFDEGETLREPGLWP